MAKSNFKHLRDSVEASWESIIRGDAYCPLRPSVRQLSLSSSSFPPPLVSGLARSHAAISLLLAGYFLSSGSADSFGLPMMFREQ